MEKLPSVKSDSRIYFNIIEKEDFHAKKTKMHTEKNGLYDKCILTIMKYCK